MSDNPFSALIDGSDHGLKNNLPDKFVNMENTILESILLITHDKDKVLPPYNRPKYLVYVQPNSNDITQLTAQRLDGAIFDRTQMRETCENSVVFLDSDVDVDLDDVVQPKPIIYITSCFRRSCSVRQVPDIVEACQKSLIGQMALLLMVDAECELVESATALYNVIYQSVSSSDSDHLTSVQLMFDLLMQHLVDISMSGDDTSFSCPDSTLNALRPLVNCLYGQLSALNPTASNDFAVKKKRIDPKERSLFCPQRQPLMRMAIWFSRYVIMSQLLIEKSFPHVSNSNTVHGYQYEMGLLGRLLISSHLHTPQAPDLTVLANNTVFGEFFTEEVPLKSSVEAEQSTIWQLTEQMDNELKNLWLNLLRIGKRYNHVKKLLFQWLRGCIQSNKARCQLAHTMMNQGLLSQSDSANLAGDGFLNNLAAVAVKLTGPLIASANDPPLDKIWPSYATDTCPERVILPDLAKETRLAPSIQNSINHTTPDDQSIDSNSTNNAVNEYPLLTELFFLAHSAVRIGWTPLITRHFETTQQLHQLESQLNPHDTASSISSPTSDPQTFYLRRFLRERTSRYLEQSTSLSCGNRLKEQLTFAVTTCRLLCKLAKLKLTNDNQSTALVHGSLSDIPEFLVDNIVELVSYMRRAKDEFLESLEMSETSLQPLLEFSILFMRHVALLNNPHLRARLAELLESLIPQRDDEAWNTSGSGLLSAFNLSFRRRQELMNRDPEVLYDPILSEAVAALLSAFVSIELSPGTSLVGSAGTAAESIIASSSRQHNEAQQSSTQHQTTNSERSSSSENDIQNQTQTATVGFEEKFHYRRPMYACLRYWHGKPLYDIQFRKLETEALEHIDDVNPPLFLQFMSLLVNDAIFLLDEAISLLAQLKQKEREREECGGRLSTAEDESLFTHTGRLARHHIMLGLDTITAFRRVVSLCPRLVTHPILVDRIACMLNYFLSRLVGPKQRDLTVRDKAAYGFKPNLLVLEICEIYQLLACENVTNNNEVVKITSTQLKLVDGEQEDRQSSTAATFRRAIVSDERSFTPDLLDQASRVLERIVASLDLRTKFAEAVKLIKAENVSKADDEVDLSDVPDDFLDPIMGDLMSDPVKLPSSGHVVDRKTIYRHLLNDLTDPFNRQPLAMSQVIPQPELRETIHNWLTDYRAKRAKLSMNVDTE